MSEREIRLRSATTIIPSRAKFAYGGTLPLGSASIIAGPAGLGKTTMLMGLCAGWADGSLAGDLRGRPTSVIYASAEDSPETTLLPRYLAAGGDPTRLYFVEVSYTEDGSPGSLTLPDDTEELGRLAAQAGAKVIILDPVVAYLSESVNAHRDQQVRRVLGPAAAMAAQHGLALISVMHLNKGESQDALTRVGGSVGFTAAARSVVLFARDPDDPDGENGTRRIIAHVKCNVGPLAPSIHAKIEADEIPGEGDEMIPTSRLVIGAESSQTARDLLAAGNVGGEEATARGEARSLLEDELRDGPRAVNELRDAADGAGLSWRTVERAKKQIGVRARKAATGWAWSLPENADGEPNKAVTTENPPGGLVGVVGLDGVKSAKTANNDKADDAYEERGEQLLERWGGVIGNGRSAPVAFCSDCNTYTEKITDPDPDGDDLVCSGCRGIHDTECSCSTPALGDPDHVDGYCTSCTRNVSYTTLSAWKVAA